MKRNNILLRQSACILLITFCVLIFSQQILAGPVSDNYELKQYSFGAGGTEESTSDAYSIQGILGEAGPGNPSLGTFKVGDGLIFTEMAAVPPAPAFTNPGSTYNRLKLVLDTASNPTDTTYAVAISTDDFTSTRWIQSDFTVGDTLGSEDWLTYTAWGSAGGQYITGLAQDTTYKVKVKARQGNYTETGFGPTATATTLVPSLTFGVSASTITFDPLNSGNSYTDSSKNTVLTTSTNAYGGYMVYGRVTQPLTSGSNTIANYASPNSSPTLWSGTGFGYTTDDSSLVGGTADRFTSGGPNFAGFSTSAPGDPVADHTGPIVETPISGETFTVSYRVTASESSLAGNYQTTILYVVVPVY